MMQVTKYFPLKGRRMYKKILNFLGLFASVSTLFCCALPALFVTLGLGASFVTILNAFPGLIWLSLHKSSIFIFGGAMLILNGALRKYSNNKMCVVEESVETCTATKKASGIIYLGSILLYLVGGYFAFIAPLFFDR